MPPHRHSATCFVAICCQVVPGRDSWHLLTPPTGRRWRSDKWQPRAWRFHQGWRIANYDAREGVRQQPTQHGRGPRATHGELSVLGLLPRLFGRPEAGLRQVLLQGNLNLCSHGPPRLSTQLV
jgi:hypothetical protein